MINEKNDKSSKYEHFNNPLSPKASPEKPLTKRQEQNRAAQRAFRERRALMLKEMDSRVSALEYSAQEFDKKIDEMDELKSSLTSLQETVDNLCMVVDTMNAPTWSVPGNDKSLPFSSPAENASSPDLDESKLQQSRAILGALRPSSTDPTLTSPPANE